MGGLSTSWYLSLADLFVILEQSVLKRMGPKV